MAAGCLRKTPNKAEFFEIEPICVWNQQSPELLNFPNRAPVAIQSYDFEALSIILDLFCSAMSFWR
jgi:hypothetical protein